MCSSLSDQICAPLRGRISTITFMLSKVSAFPKANVIRYEVSGSAVFGTVKLIQPFPFEALSREILAGYSDESHPGFPDSIEKVKVSV